MHGDTQSHDIRDTPMGCYTRMATVPFVIPCLERKPPPVGTEPTQTPVPDRSVTAKHPPSLPFRQLEGRQGQDQGPAGTIGLPLPIISRHVNGMFKSLSQHYHTTRP